MDLKDQRQIAAPREAVFEALNDPDILARAIPGCESLDKVSDTEFAATVTAKVGPVRAKFKGQVTLSDLNPPESYTISGASKRNGEYVLAGECNSKPAYQLTAGGYVLFQPTYELGWWVGSSDRSTSCAYGGFIASSGNGGECPLSPDGGGCAGRWQEYDGDAWLHAQGLAVSSATIARPVSPSTVRCSG